MKNDKNDYSHIIFLSLYYVSEVSHVNRVTYQIVTNMEIPLNFFDGFFDIIRNNFVVEFEEGV